jgi:1-aminocyclopropane-1-carboxylate deaminase
MLDHVYTAKMMYGVLDLVRRGFIRGGTKVLTIHTGGLQGMPCRVV